MKIIICLMYVLAAWKWANWRNWQKYYPTYVYLLASEGIGFIVTYKHTLWRFYPSFLLPNHTLMEACVAFVAYPAIVLLYMSRYPNDDLYKKGVWIGLFVILTTFSEVIAHYWGLIVYENGWSLGWTTIFNLVMFIVLRVHYLRPPFAWCLWGVFSAFIWFYFDFSLQDLK